MGELVSVVLPAYNAAGQVAETLDSILAQDYHPLELIVVDDGSTDGTARTVQPFLADGRVRLLRQSNRGVAAARNLGVRAARGRLVAFCDSDDLWRPAKLRRQVPLLEDSAVALAYCGADSLIQGRVVPAEPQRLPQGDCFAALAFRNFVVCSAALARREDILAAGMFEERRDLQGVEDKHLWMRLADRGELRAVPEPLVLYRHSGAGVSSNLERMLRAEEICLKDLARRGLRHHDPALYQAAWRSIQRQYGTDLFHRGLYAPARRALGAALAQGDVAAAPLWLASCLPPPVVRAGRRLRCRLAGRPHSRAAIQ